MFSLDNLTSSILLEFSWSHSSQGGCEDDDTSSDAASMYAAPGGAMTKLCKQGVYSLTKSDRSIAIMHFHRAAFVPRTAFCDVLRRNPRPYSPQACGSGVITQRIETKCFWHEERTLM